MTVAFRNQTKLRVCTLSDVPALTKVASLSFEETFGDTLSKEETSFYEKANFQGPLLCKSILHPLTHFVVVTSHARPVAYMKLNYGKMQTENNFPDGIEIEHLYVLKAFQGKGIGHALVEYAVDYAKKEDLKTLWVAVWEKNPDALAFYQQMGFKTKGTRPSRIGEGKDTLVQKVV